MKRWVCLSLLLFALTGCSGRLNEVVSREFSVMGAGSVREQSAVKSEAESGTDEADSLGGTDTQDGADGQGDRNASEAGTETDGAPAGEEGENFLYDGAFEYSAQYLSEAQLAWYMDIRRALGRMQEKIRLNGAALQAGCSEEDIDRIFQCVLNDHPEFFYVEGYSYTKYTRGDKITAIDFSGSYNMDKEAAGERRGQIEAAAARFLAGIDGTADQYAKAKYVYDAIIRQTEYDTLAPDNQNIYSVFLGGRSVCQGYAKAAQYLLNRLGVDCTLVLGTVQTQGKQERHAWNLVRIDGEYYYLDATWGDASYNRQGGDESAEETAGDGSPKINYDYLNVTSKELLKTHTPDGNVPMPECIAVQANYYVREGALFESYDREQMQALFDRARAEGREDVAVKCAQWECYREMLEALVEKKEVFRYLGELEASVAFARNDLQMSLTFWVTNGQ